jgi:uncharacterized protein (DUF2164 family)
MAITLSKEDQDQAIASMQRYFEENLDGEIGRLPAQLMLEFFLTEIGPAIYNKAVRDTQEKIALRVSELDIEVHEDEFQYWRGSRA